MPAETPPSSMVKPLALGLLATAVLLFLTFSANADSNGLTYLISGLGLMLIFVLTQGQVRSLRRLQHEQQKRLTAEAELDDSEAKQHAVIDTMVDAAIIMSKDGTVQSINPAAETMFGYPADELIGQNIKMLMPEPYRSEHDGYLAHHLATGEKRVLGKRREVKAMHRDGRIFPIELAVTDMHIRGQRLFSGIVRDISERKKVDRMKDEFIATVSHELRTPLTAIRGSLGLLAGGAGGELPTRANTLLNLAHSNSERLLVLINNLLDMERITSGQLAFNFAPLAVAPFIAQAVDDNRPFAEQCSIRLAITACPDTAFVYADPERLQQVMSNLLSNACKFSPRGSRVEIACQRHDDRIRISVTDHGPGIPEAFHPKLFEKFTQADASDSRQVGGTGLGLSISKAIIEKHGGEIGFRTAIDQGSTFFVDLPVSEPPTTSDAFHNPDGLSIDVTGTTPRIETKETP